jgi:hypothetical protein
MGLNQAFTTDPLVSNTTGGSGVPTSTFFRGRQMPFDEYAKYRQGYRGQVAGSPTQAPEGPTMAPEGLGVPEATQTPPERQTPQEGLPTPKEESALTPKQTDWLNTHGGKGGSDLADVLDENGYL